MKNNYMRYGLLLFSPFLFTHDNNQEVSSYIAALNNGFHEASNSNYFEFLKQQLPDISKEFEHEVLLPNTISRRFAIQEYEKPVKKQEAYPLLNDQIFLVNKRGHCAIMDLSKDLVLSTIPKKSDLVKISLSTSKNILALEGDKIKNIDTRFSVILYNITNLSKPDKLKHLKFNKPILDMQFIPEQDDKIAIVTNEPFSERLRLYDITHDIFVDIHTDFIKNLRITPESLYFYNFKDKKIISGDTDKKYETKPAIYIVDYKALYIYQLLKASKQSPIKPTELNLTRASMLEAPEQN